MRENKKSVEVATGCETTQETAGKTAKREREWNEKTFSPIMMRRILEKRFGDDAQVSFYKGSMDYHTDIVLDFKYSTIIVGFVDIGKWVIYESTIKGGFDLEKGLPTARFVAQDIIDVSNFLVFVEDAVLCGYKVAESEGDTVNMLKYYNSLIALGLSSEEIAEFNWFNDSASEIAKYMEEK